LSQSGIKKRVFLSLGLSANIGILVFYKYTNAILSTVNHILSGMHLNSILLTSIVLPIGLSFIVFGKITYLADIYRGVASPAQKVTSYLTYVFLFPKLLAGPIVKYHEIEGQISERLYSLDDISLGICRFSWGLAKKVFIADTLGALADLIFGLPANELGLLNSWFGAICFTVQIYFDFSAYSDMAIGLARIMGFRIVENFNMPYISSNFTEFWRRWHISLSTWIRDYLYVPLGGNRCSKPRMYFNLWVCFLLCGLWHGANWTFVLWGAYHGIFLIADKMFALRIQKKLPRIFNVVTTFILVTIGWVIFRSGSFEQMSYYFRAMFNPDVLHGRFIFVANDSRFFLALGLFLIFFPLTNIYSKLKRLYLKTSVNRKLEIVVSFIILLLSIFRISTSTFNPFLYFRF
jgi:alginate O-acetyltransferase complex protein AlgI